MVSEPDTPEDTGTDNAQPQEADTSEAWDEIDLDDVQDTDELPDAEETDDEEQAEPDTEEAPEVEDEAEEEVEDAPDDEHPDKPAGLVTLADGSEVTHDELIKGYLRQNDYTRKQQETAQKRDAVVAEAERMERITSGLVEHLAKMMPEEPSLALAYSDSATYTAKQAQYDFALSQLESLIALSEQPKEITQKVSQEDAQARRNAENAKLNEVMPETATRKGREQLWADVQAVAKEVGFSNEELAAQDDHRVFYLASLAKKGLDATKAQSKAKAKAVKAPPATPRKPGQGAANPDVKKKRDAMQRLLKDDSLDNAIAALRG